MNPEFSPIVTNAILICAEYDSFFSESMHTGGWKSLSCCGAAASVTVPHDAPLPDTAVTTLHRLDRDPVTDLEGGEDEDQRRDEDHRDGDDTERLDRRRATLALATNRARTARPRHLSHGGSLTPRAG